MSYLRKGLQVKSVGVVRPVLRAKSASGARGYPPFYGEPLRGCGIKSKSRAPHYSPDISPATGTVSKMTLFVGDSP